MIRFASYSTGIKNVWTTDKDADVTDCADEDGAKQDFEKGVAPCGIERYLGAACL
jgi:hypothetical protein